MNERDKRRQIAGVRYAETAPPPGLEGWVKASWTLDCESGPDAFVEHTATPDGCIELIRRRAGRSAWGGWQPEVFVAGVITRPARLWFSGDARFEGLRIWPWAWNALTDLPAGRFVGSWLALDEAAPHLSAAAWTDRLPKGLADLAERPPYDLGDAILRSANVDDLVRWSGIQRRTLQRRFAREIGVAPRAYLRLLRFQGALETVQEQGSSLADQAAAHGFADQAHMSREFRALAGTTTGGARRAARGPFL